MKIYFLFVLLFFFSSSLVNAYVDDDFIRTCGNQICWKGNVVKLRGFTYYPQLQATNGWSDSGWNEDVVRRELIQARSYKANTIRLMVPYSEFGWSRDGVVDPAHLERLAKTVEIAKTYGLKSIITLFDWYFDVTHWPPDWPQTPAVFDPNNSSYLASYNKTNLYVTTIVNRFKDEKGVLAWDVKNEPDGGNFWSGDPESGWRAPWVMFFLKHNRDLIKSIDGNHLVTIGCVNYFTPFVKISQVNNLSIADLSDFVSFHDYTSDLLVHINSIKSTGMNKPVVLEEVSWPTVDFTSGVGWNGYPASSINENEQLLRLKSAYNAIASSEISGAINWELYDHRLATVVDAFGLIRPDGSEKPAGTFIKETTIIPPFPFDVTLILNKGWNKIEYNKEIWADAEQTLSTKRCSAISTKGSGGWGSLTWGYLHSPSWPGGNTLYYKCL